MNNSFFSVLLSVCTGTDIFVKLINFKLFRTIRYLIYLSILCSIGFTLVKTPEIKNDINSMAGYFYKNFGNIVVKDNGVFPDKAPETSRKLSFNSVQINYFPSIPPDGKYNIDDNLNRSGFIWLPNSVIGWMKLDDTSFFVYQALTSIESHNWFGMVTKENMPSYLKSCTLKDFNNLRLSFFIPVNIPLFGLIGLNEINHPESFTDTVYYWSAFGIVSRFILTIIFNAFFYSVLFALIYSVSSRSTFVGLKFKNFLVLALYAGFPGIIIGTIFSATELPWLQYQTVYLLCLVIYLIIVTNNLENLVMTKTLDCFTVYNKRILI